MEMLHGHSRALTYVCTHQLAATKVTVFLRYADYEYELLVWPARAGWIRKTAWIMTWPIHLIFMCTIPDCEKPRFKNWFPVTFLMCIIWIGSLSYVVAWMITIIGKGSSGECT